MNPLVQTWTHLRGNPRACVLTEPLWGLSMNLCLPYASVYMIALGLKDAELGLIASIYMGSQAVFAFLSGPITDKLGRRRTTALFDFVAWCIPCLLWRQAGGFWFFFAAALLNGAMKVPTNSWDCLLVEDAEKPLITRIYSLVMVCGQASALFAPIAALLVARLTLVPAVRLLYLNAFIVMSLKIILLYWFSRETQTGLVRMRETRGRTLVSLLRGYGGVVRLMAASPGTLFSLLIAALVNTTAMINTTFWQVIVSKKLLVSDTLLPLFPMVRSLLALCFFFTVIPRLTARQSLRLPLVLGFAAYALGQALLMLTPVGALRYPVLSLSLVFDSFGAGILAMLAESLVALHVNAQERARVMALQHMLIMGIAAPFGWIAGLLSGYARSLPFALNLLLLALGLFATLRFFRARGADGGTPDRA